MSYKQGLGSPYASMLTAANDQYHAVTSINKFGPIEHSRAVATILLNQQAAKDEWEAVTMADTLLKHARALAENKQVNKLAHELLKGEAKEKSKSALRLDSPGLAPA
ncbi:hypothetical protein ABC383_17770 [Noviherbaspirillum sp. 1P10PC]|uniref:hypothetical protein n=1 Tax=Noviherbaspirillum sp. 1P10PC TaxID=3132292 RepID=UPI00399F7489